MISIIICSRNQTLLKQVSKNIESTIGTDYELIVINNSSNEYSLNHAYNIGAKQAKFEYLLFIHEDLLFHTKEWGSLLMKHLEAPDIALVGVLGCTIKSKCPSGVWVPVEGVNRMNHLQRDKNGNTSLHFENPYQERFSEVAVVDGMLLATRKENWERKPFDEITINGFHGYDIDFSLSQQSLGKVVVVYDILIEHFSHGNFTRQWVEAQLKITGKWKESLPLSMRENIIDLDIKKVEGENTRFFLRALIQNNFGKRLEIHFLCKLLLLSFRPSQDHYYLRKVLLGNQLDSRIISFFNWLIRRKKQLAN